MNLSVAVVTRREICSEEQREDTLTPSRLELGQRRGRGYLWTRTVASQILPREMGWVIKTNISGG